MSARRLSLLALLLCACPPPAPDDGYQVRCDSYRNSNGNGSGPVNPCTGPNCPSQPTPTGDDRCPKGTQCFENCCVRPGETPRCQRYVGSSWGGSEAIGRGCTQGCSDAGCGDLCPSWNAGTCFTEQAFGLPGGACTWDMSKSSGNCPSGPHPIIASLGNPGICLQSCDWQNCRDGWRCDCSANTSPPSCVCVPDCASAPKSCGPGRTLLGERCNAATGFCYVAADCLASYRTCQARSDCCPSNTCRVRPLADAPRCEPCAETCGEDCCTTDQSCNAGACCTKQYQTCTKSAECCPGSACSNEVNTNPQGNCQPCTACGSECCTNGRQCANDHCCSPQWNPCRDASQCCQGLTCQNGVCR